MKILPKQDMPHDSSYIQFFMKKPGRLNKRKTREAGTPVYDDVPMIRFLIAGDQRFSPVFPAHDESDYRDPNGRKLTYAEAFPESFAAFLEGRDAVQGISLDAMPDLSPAQIATLNAANVMTVQQLANADVSHLGRLGNFATRDLIERAKTFLQGSGNVERLSELQAENMALSARLERLEKQLKGEAEPIEPTAEAKGPSPFEGWKNEDLINYIREQGNRDAPARASKAALIKIAEEVAGEITKG